MLEQKVAQFREYFKKSFVEIREFCELLFGLTGDGLMYKLDPNLSQVLEINSFRAEPTKLNESGKLELEYIRDNALYKVIIKRILKAIKEDEIYSHAIKLQGFMTEFPPHDLTYLIPPEEGIFLILTEGFPTPIELQSCLGYCQTEKIYKKLSKPNVNQIKREAVVQFLLHQYPNESIKGICRKLSELIHRHGDFNSAYKIAENYRYDFLFKSPSKAYELVKMIKEKDHLIPGILLEQNGRRSFAFQKIKIVVCTLKKLFLIYQHDVLEHEFLQHPLLSPYVKYGGSFVEKIINFSIRRYFNY